jgi:hypothetical protein
MFCNLIYDACVDNLPRPILIGLLFWILYIAVAATVFITGGIRSTFADESVPDFLDSKIKIILAVVAGGITVFLFATLFQWIYGLNAEKADVNPTSYVFIIDDSDSMLGNDPNVLRYSSIKEIINKMPVGFPYMVYSFSDTATLIKDMAPAADADALIPPENAESGTMMKAALAQVFDDYESGVWSGGTDPKVVLLSDGVAQDIGVFDSGRALLDRYSKNGISISTVGFGAVNKRIMNNIAKHTGGVFIYADDVTNLAQAMAGAAIQYSLRDLLSYRPTMKNNALYGALRITFLLILGALIAGFMIVAYTREDEIVWMGVAGLATAFLGSLIMEISVQAGLDEKISWMLLWILIAATFARICKDAVGSVRNNRVIVG